MAGKPTQPIVANTLILLISLLVGALTQGSLAALGIPSNSYGQLLVAALAFAATFVGLRQGYETLIRVSERNANLEGEVDGLRKLTQRLERDNLKLAESVQSLTSLRADLARAVATQFARDIVRDSGEDVQFLATAYADTKAYLPVHFRAQGSEWLQVLAREFESETVIAARQVPAFANWNPNVSVEDLEPVAVLPVPGSRRPPYDLIKILFLAANPSDTTRLRLDEEIRTIDEKLLQARYRDRFDIEQQWAVRIGDLQGILLRHRPDILHFSGHGSDAGEIILEDEQGNSRTVPTGALSHLFANFRENIRCVVLNACYSEVQARAIAEQVPCVVGMSQEIGDLAAIAFAAAFYQALGYGQDVRRAFEMGLAQLQLENHTGAAAPKLWALQVDPQMIRFAPGVD